MTFRVSFVHAPHGILSEHPSLGWRYPPTWALTLAAHIPEKPNWQVQLHDLRLISLDRVPPADVFLFTGLNQDLPRLAEVVGLLKGRNPAAKFVLGGPICWSFDQAGDLGRLGGFDHLVIGDGESVIAGILERIAEGGGMPGVIRVPEPFDLRRAKPFALDLAEDGAYHEGVIEVSRGCPFLCEFCDVRVLPENNRSRTKSPDLIVEEMEMYARRGATSFMFACDNFIGDPRWANEVSLRIIEWRERTGFTPNIFTWVTLNLHRRPELLSNMRKAGFNTLFIGVESFRRSSLQETAKVQNACVQELPDVLKTIQSYGFLVVAGLIFGFDSDLPDLFDVAEDGLQRAGVICFSPSLLVALPGTPLYRRMKLAGRLREPDHASPALRDVDHHRAGRFHSNVKFLLGREVIVDGYTRFVRRTSAGRSQFARFRAYLENLMRPQYIPRQAHEPGRALTYAGSMLGNWRALPRVAANVIRFGASPVNLWYAALGLRLALARRKQIPDAWIVFVVWMAAWLDYSFVAARMREGAFDVEALAGPVSPAHILPEGYELAVAERAHGRGSAAQLRTTAAQLRNTIRERASGRV